MKILVLTPYWPSQTHPSSGVFVQRQVNFLRSKGVDVTVFHLKGGGNVINYFKAIVRIRELTKLNSYDLIHAHWGYSSLPALFTNLPLFITFRGSDLMGTYKSGKPTLTGKLIVLFSKLASRFAKALIFVSKDLSGQINNNVPKFIIPSGLSFETLPLLDKESTKKKTGATFK